jgi:hypothetical protein
LGDLISKRSRQLIREYFVGTSLRVIEMAFDAADIACDSNYKPSVGGQRRTFVEQYYKTLDWRRPGDVRKFLAVVSGVIDDLEDLEHRSPVNADYVRSERSRLITSLDRDGWKFVDGKFTGQSSGSHLADIAASVARIDAPELQRQIERMRGSVDTDPALTLGTAKELIETACKTILEEREHPVDPSWDLGRLVKETREALKLLPSDIPDAVKGADAIKRLLSNLGAVAQGLGELRNLYGSGHGRSGKRRTIEPRHARLSSGTAAALATFLLETHWERKK